MWPTACCSTAARTTPTTASSISASGPGATINVTAPSTIENSWTGKNLYLDGQLTGNGGLTFVNAGNGQASQIYITNNADNYSGVLTVSGSSGSGLQLVVSSSSALQNATVNVNGTAGNANQALNGGGSIIFAGTNGAAAYGGLGFGTSLPSATFGALEGNGNFSLSTTNGATRLTVGGNNATTTYSGVLSGSGSLVKVGGGELTLSGFNTMTGGLTISGGTVALVASGGTGTLPNNTNIYVNSSAELLINGADSLGYNPGTNIYLTDGLVSVTSGNRGSFNIISMTGGTIGSAPGIGDGSGNWLLNGQPWQPRTRRATRR